MFLKLALLCFALIFSSCLGQEEEEEEGDRFQHRMGQYTIVAPGTVRSQSPYHVAISLEDFHQSCRFNISVKIDDDRQEKFVKTVEVKPRSVELVQLQMPTLNDGFGSLLVSGYDGIISSDIAQLNVEGYYYSVMIQTNKPKYRPGDLLQFRVICIDRLTLPAVIDGNIVVVIYDGQGNRIKEFSAVKLVQGVFKGDLQLSEHPVLGEWKIEVHVDGRVSKQKVFQVATYVLPSFSVEIITKNDFFVDEADIQMTIKASYTYGEPVKGNLSLGVHNTDPKLNDQQTRVFKKLQIDGITNVTLDLKTILNASGIEINRQRPLTVSALTLEAAVQDSLTRQISVAKTQVALHNQPFMIHVKAPKYFDQRQPVDVKVSVRDLQNKPIRDSKNPVTIAIEGSERYGRGVRTDLRDKNKFFGPGLVPDTSTVLLDEDGSGIVHVNLSEKNFKLFRLKATYLEWTSNAEFLEKVHVEGFTLDILTPHNEVGKELVAKLTSPDAIDHFNYDIISRGDIIRSERVVVPGNDTTYLLRINATYAMVPIVTLFVHRVKRKLFDCQLKDVYIKRDFQNFIEVNADAEVEPGAQVSVNVTTNADSYVGLIGQDQKLLLSTNNENDLTQDHIFTALQSYGSLNLNHVRFPAIKAGLLTFSNSLNRAGLGIGQAKIIFFGAADMHPLTRIPDKPVIELPRIRKLFSDSWMFRDFESTPKEGLHLHETVPDTITSWAITGFSLNPETGISLTKNATKLKVFQSFFISMDLPSLVKEGEVIETPVYVFNYMDQDLVTDVTIESDSDNVEFLESPNAGSQASSNQTISKSVPAQGKVKVVFFIRPRRSGEHNVTVKAISPAASDAVQKRLVVEFEGVPYSFSKTYLVHFLQEGNQEDEFSVDIPPTAIPGSESVQLSVVGDVFGPLVRSLHKLARVPYGNCEENMRYFVSNLLVLKYLKTFNHSNPSLETKTKLHLELGYQTQMVFKHLDGSFSLFDRTKERTGDLWVTAYVMWGLQQASQYIKVDPKVTDSGLEYLRRKQREDGGLSRGKGVEDDVTLTAFTLLAFMVTDESQNRTKDAVSKGLKFLYETLDDLEEPAHAAMTKYALILGKHEKSEELLSSLKSRAGFTSKQMEWIMPDTLQGSLQMTAGSFMSLLESQATPVETLFPVVRALISSAAVDQTPVHLLALEAMIKIARDMDFGKKDLSIHFSDGLGKSGDLRVDSSNAQLQQTVELNKASRKVRLETKGSGFAVVNIKYKYNLAQGTQPSPSIYTTNATIKESTDSIMVLEVCLAAPSSDSRSNLTVMEVNLQSGYEVSERTFNVVLEKNDHVKSIQVNDNAASVRAYIEGVDKDGTCIQLEAVLSYKVFETKPISIVVYDAFNEDLKSTSLHETNAAEEDILV